MAESMQGLKRTHRCGETPGAHISEADDLRQYRRDSHHHGLGAEKPEQRRSRLCGRERPLRDHTGSV